MMFNYDPDLLGAVEVIIIIGSAYSFLRMILDFLGFIDKISKECKVNIFEVEDKLEGDSCPIKARIKGSSFFQPIDLVNHSPSQAHQEEAEERAYVGQHVSDETISINRVNIIENEAEMREALQSLLNFISGNIPDNLKWQMTNGIYCRLTCGKPREKSEVIRTYFRKIDQVFKRKDGTIYSKVVSPEEAKEIIEELIEVYPWDIPFKKVEPIKNSIDEQRANEIDALKESVRDLMVVIAEINDRLDKIK